MNKRIIADIFVWLLAALLCMLWRWVADKSSFGAYWALFGVMTVLAEVPAFLIGIALLFLVAAKVKWIPLQGAQSSFVHYRNAWEWAKDIGVHSLMPILAMVLTTVPMFYFTARSSFPTVL